MPLLHLLHPTTHKWERIATFLKLGEGSIANIKANNSPAEDKLLEVIKRWLKNVSPPPTVMSLVKVLREPYIGEEKVALEILKKFCPAEGNYT